MIAIFILLAIFTTTVAFIPSLGRLRLSTLSMVTATCTVTPQGKPCEGGSDAGNICQGVITFDQPEEDGPTTISWKVTGLEPGLHGFHIHEKADFSDGCMS